MVLAYGGPVVHGVEGRDLVHTHGWHLQYPRDLIHDADASETMLSLSEIEKRHNSSLLVVGRVSRNDLLDELLILGTKLEWNGRVVLWGITVLRAVLAMQLTFEDLVRRYLQP